MVGHIVCRQIELMSYGYGGKGKERGEREEGESAGLLSYFVPVSRSISGPCTIIETFYDRSRISTGLNIAMLLVQGRNTRDSQYH